ncbi:MAG: aspartate/glutamate racemase family protein [Pseudomonadota bacterium]
MSNVRIWHQSITDLEVLPAYRQNLQSIAARLARSDTSVVIHGVSPGTYPKGMAPIAALRYPWLHHLLTTQVVQGAIAAEEAGFDAVAISCFFDPGLREARSLVDIPVVSACETSLIAALTTGEACGLIALDTHHAGFLGRLVSAYGLSGRVAAITPLDPAVTELELEGEVKPTELLERMERAAWHAVRAGADVLVPAEGVLNSMLVAEGIRSLAGAPVIDGFAAVIAHAEMLVHLRRKAALSVSRLGALARPGKAAALHMQEKAADTLRARR